MKLLIILCAFVIGAFAQLPNQFNYPNNRFGAGFLPAGYPSPYFHQSPEYTHQYVRTPIVRQHYESTPGGSYDYSYETENGVVVEEKASIIPTGPEQAEKSVSGSYRYALPDAQVSVSYKSYAYPHQTHVPYPRHGLVH